ncbi:NACHT domain-containing protein [Lipingzhangella sp. LS1_29]|uniref:NACHT domain-containing protein n=1 Tax=Lipingzhangella rawalii TaxID=2055835 RepID=A0ABU2H607_9ACTN|nr:NACHT domain-containing protein [Lipingzhangella rawalii]MDS1270749.1 NACHT domain-containing protein [Lipingzhangella rawalii]
MTLDSLAIEAGSLLVQHALQHWTDNRRQAVSREAQLVELLPGTIADRLLRRRLSGQFNGIVDNVAERLVNLCAQEFRGLSDADKAGALAAVVDTLVAADLSDAELFAADLDAEQLATRLHARMPQRGASHELGQDGAAFYTVVLEECCGCLVRLVQQRPEFLVRAQRETLQRVGGMAEEICALGQQVTAVLDRMPVRTLDAPEGTSEDAEFTRRYAEHLSQTLDYVELFGVSVHDFRPRTALSVAYISLQVSTRSDREGTWPRLVDRHGMGATEPESRQHTARVQAEAALAQHRLTLVRGEAGSGKSTLLRWLAITAARGGFTGELQGWNGLTPFLVKLRSHAEGELPAPEALPQTAARPLAGHMPRGWAHRRLRSGQALLLVDGVDELPQRRREGVRGWLRELIAAFPELHVVVTSRPAAAAEQWLSGEGFRPVFMEPLSPPETEELVHHWHRAMRDSPHLPCGAEELDSHAARLLGRLSAAPHLRHLASSPLLAAMLCALNLDRNRLPHNRMDLYAETLDMLLERRDTRRGIPSHAEEGPDRREKLRLLQDLAFRLSSTGRAELSRDAARARIAQQLPSMPRVNAEPEQVLVGLLERSGVLRAPAMDRVDFVHRTVQEYLTAQQIVYDDDLEYLVDQAHKDKWRETVIMAAGHANGPQLRTLVRGLRKRIAAGGRHTRQLKVLLACCMETLDEAPSEVREAIDTCLDHLVPPRDLRAARSLATVGEPVLDRLPETLDGLSEPRARAAVRTAWLVNGPRAIEALSRYATDPRPEVQHELRAAWSYFDAEEYARRVLADAPLLNEGYLQIENPRLLGTLRHLRHLTKLQCTGMDIPDLGFLENVAALKMVSLYSFRSGDLTPLSVHSNSLASINLCSTSSLKSMVPLTELSRLEKLMVQAPSLGTLKFLRDLPHLTGVFLFGESLAEVGDTSPIVEHDRLVSFGLEFSSNVRKFDLDFLGSFPNLRLVHLRGGVLDSDIRIVALRAPHVEALVLPDANFLRNIDDIANLSLNHLVLGGCQEVRDFSWLSSLSGLESLYIRSSGIADLTPIRNLQNLDVLAIENCEYIQDLSPISGLPYLRTLHLCGARPGLDLAPLAGQKNLQIFIYRGQDVRNRRALGRGVRVIEVDS